MSADLHVLGLHALLRDAQEQRQIHRLAQNGEEADGGEAASVKGSSAPPDARANRAGRRVVAKGRTGLLPIPRGSGQHRSVSVVPTPVALAVARHPVSSQSEGTQVLEAAQSTVGPLGSSPSRSASLSDGPFLRYSSKVGAQCISSARWDLCGGCRVTGIPTANS